MNEPMSVYSTHSSNSIALLAAAQAIFRGHDVTMYGALDSPIVMDAARLAKEEFGMQDADIRFIDEVDEQGRPISSIHFSNGGILRLRTTGVPHTLDEMQPPLEVRIRADKDLYDLAIADEVSVRKRGDASIAFNIHDIHFSGYVADAGLTNAIFHSHMEPASSKDLAGKRLEIISELGGRIYNGQLLPAQRAIAISGYNAMNWRAAGADILDIVEHGVLLPPVKEVKINSAGYLLWMGRLTEVKGPDKAVEIAKRAGMPLLMAGNTAFSGEREYFDAHIRPHITLDLSGRPSEEIRWAVQELRAHTGSYGNNPPIIFVGEVSDMKSYLYGNADAVVMPLGWQEAFGLVAIEAKAHGTPVVTFSEIGALRTGIIGVNYDAIEFLQGDVDRIGIARGEIALGNNITASSVEEAIERAAHKISIIKIVDRLRIRKEAEKFDIRAEVVGTENAYLEFSNNPDVAKELNLKDLFFLQHFDSFPNGFSSPNIMHTYDHAPLSSAASVGACAQRIEARLQMFEDDETSLFPSRALSIPDAQRGFDEIIRDAYWDLAKHNFNKLWDGEQGTRRELDVKDHVLAEGIITDVQRALRFCGRSYAELYGNGIAGGNAEERFNELTAWHRDICEQYHDFHYLHQLAIAHWLHNEPVDTCTERIKDRQDRLGKYGNEIAPLFLPEARSSVEIQNSFGNLVKSAYLSEALFYNFTLHKFLIAEPTCQEITDRFSLISYALDKAGAGIPALHPDADSEVALEVHARDIQDAYAKRAHVCARYLYGPSDSEADKYFADMIASLAAGRECGYVPVSFTEESILEMQTLMQEKCLAFARDSVRQLTTVLQGSDTQHLQDITPPSRIREVLENSGHSVAQLWSGMPEPMAKALFEVLEARTNNILATAVSLGQAEEKMRSVPNPSDEFPVTEVERGEPRWPGSLTKKIKPPDRRTLG